MRLIRWHLAVIVIVALTACTGEPGATSSPPPDQVVAPSGSLGAVTTDGDGTGATVAPSSESVATSVVLPDISPNERAVLMVASERLVAECMSRQGFQFVPLDLATATAIAEARTDEQRADLPIDGAVETKGYVQPRLAPAREYDNDAYANALDAEARDTWGRAALGDFGDAVTVDLPDGNQVSIPKSGCLSEARVALYGSIEDAVMFEMGVSGMRFVARTTADADPDVGSARAAWESCMSASGWTFEHFTQARQYAAQHPDEASSVWSADRSCTASSGLREVFVRVLQRSIEDVVASNLGLIEQYESSVEVAIDRAAEVLAG